MLSSIWQFSHACSLFCRHVTRNFWPVNDRFVITCLSILTPASTSHAMRNQPNQIKKRYNVTKDQSLVRTPKCESDVTREPSSLSHPTEHLSLTVPLLQLLNLSFFEGCSIISPLLLRRQKNGWPSPWHATFIEPPNDFMTQSLAHIKFNIGNIKNAQMVGLQWRNRRKHEVGFSINHG